MALHTKELKELRFLRSTLEKGNALHTTQHIEQWLEKQNQAVQVRVFSKPLTALNKWMVDAPTGNIVHESGRLYFGFQLSLVCDLVGSPISRSTSVGR